MQTGDRAEQKYNDMKRTDNSVCMKQDIPLRVCWWQSAEERHERKFIEKKYCGASSQIRAHKKSVVALNLE
jgi:hypothetical protein